MKGLHPLDSPSPTYFTLVDLTFTSIMCHWRRVTNVYRRCGHSVTLPDEMIHCGSPTCKFSPAHPIDCLPPNCSQTCWQYRQYPEQYTPQKDAYCPSCQTLLANASR